VLVKLIAATFMLTFLVSQSLAQSPSLQGLVTDQNGAVVPDATVTATAQNGAVKTVTTDKAGFYSFRGLTPGSYSITASAPSLNELEHHIVFFSPISQRHRDHFWTIV
jgi:protocatechuate 3,4-dioxygenase beta subunit